MTELDKRLDVDKLIAQAREAVQDEWAAVDQIERYNQKRVLDAFHAERVGEEHFAGSTGYGANDIGRETLERLFARVFGAESALVRPQIASGTHAISACLFGVLRPGDHVLSASGPPYETLQQVIRGPRPTALTAQRIEYDEVPLTEDGDVDVEAVLAALKPNTRMIMLQRSRGYTFRPALTVARLGRVISAVKKVRPDVVCFVDNCYGEFVEAFEPTHAGADLIAGSLIKNAGGGVAPAGGYIAGKAELVSMAADRITAPGLGSKLGPTLGVTRDMFFGLFQAPHAVAEALRGAMLVGQLFHTLGYEVAPKPGEQRSDIVQAIRLDDEGSLRAFCAAVQSAGPVDSYVTPEPGAVPGYDVPVVMAGGTFVQGSSIELSADGPMRPPYYVFVQGGLSRMHVEIALGTVLRRLVEEGYLREEVPAY